MPNPAQPETVDLYRFYGDAACSRPVRFVGPAEPVGRLATVPTAPPGACERPHAVYRVGEPIGLGKPVHLSIDGVCTHFTNTTGDEMAYELGERLEPNGFVGGQLRIESRGGRLAAQVFDGEDGSARILQVVDEETGVPCEAMFTHGTCLPTPLAWDADQFADPACTVATGYASVWTPTGLPCGHAQAIVSLGESTCDGPSLSLYEIGAPVGDVYAAAPDGCALVPPEAVADHETYERGPAIPLDRLPVVVNQLVGEGRLAASYVAGATEGPFVASYGPTFLDRELNVHCRPGACDGERCVPDADGLTPVFLDAACTEPAALQYIPSPPCPAETPSLAWLWTDDPLCPLGELRRLGEPVSPPPDLVYDVYVGCNPMGVSSEYRVVHLGDAIPAQAMAPLVLREP